MTDESMRKLRAILKIYQERAAKAAPGPKPAHGEEERRRRECGERLQKVVRPVLRDFMTELREAGHEASLQDETESADEYPSVTLVFTPRSPGDDALASELTFRYDPRRGVTVLRDVKPAATKGKLVTGSHDRVGMMKVDAVSTEWVETKTMSFIEAVLKVNC